MHEINVVRRLSDMYFKHKQIVNTFIKLDTKELLRLAGG